MNKNISKKMSYVLRHHPESLELVLDEYGWCNFKQLCEKLNESEKVVTEVINTIKSSNAGSRFRFNDDKTMVKANQGHSIDIKNDIPEVNPPFILYHGTKDDIIHSILRDGLKKMKRQHVHLSKDIPTALEVASRRKGRNIVLEIEAKSMYDDNIKIYLSENGVYLTDYVDPKYIKISKLK